MDVVDVVVALVMLIGVVGVVVPVLPGLFLIAGAGVAWAIADGGGAVRVSVAAIIVVLAIAGAIAGWVLPGRRAAGRDVPRVVLAGVAVGMVIGFFTVPVVGVLLGAPAGAFVVELVRLRDPRAAWRGAVDALKDFGVGVAVQLGFAVAMVAVWVAGVVAT